MSSSKLLFRLRIGRIAPSVVGKSPSNKRKQVLPIAWLPQFPPTRILCDRDQTPRDLSSSRLLADVSPYPDSMT